MTIAEKLLALSYFAERDPTNLGGLRWRLFTILDEINDQQIAKDNSFLDDVLRTIRSDIDRFDPKGPRNG